MSETASAQVGTREPSRLRLAYRGTGGDFLLVLLKNVLLTAVTLGLYLPWAKTARRQYVWSQVDVGGQRLVYTGTGKELFFGYLKVGAVYAIAFLTPMGLGKISAKAQLGGQFLVAIVVLMLIPFAIYWSRAYILSRTTWRGIGFGLKGKASAYAKTFLGGGLLTLLTLGIYGPVWGNWLRRLMTNNTYFGSQPFAYDGRDRDVFILSVKGFLLSLVTLGIYWFWFQAALQRYTFEHTSFMRARGRFELSGGDLFKLFVLNLLGTTLSLGLAFPWIATYNLRKIAGGISFEGTIDLSTVEQRAFAGSGAGEGFADVVGVDLGL